MTCGEDHFLVREPVAIPGIQVLLVRFACQFLAGTLERGKLAIRPCAGALGLGKDSEQEWVPEEGLQSTVDGFPQEALGIRCAQASQNAARILPGEGINPQEVKVVAVDSRG